MFSAKRAVVVFFAFALLFAGCEALKTSKPIMPIKDYERMLVGSFEADYIGTANCLKSCHYHDKIKRDFEASTMGAQLSKDSGLPLVDCESCHGPGSLAVKGLTPEKVEEDRKNGIQTACDYKTLIDIKNLPAQAQSLICLKCHTANATFNLHNWNSSTHAVMDVTCSDCHNIHAGPDLIVRHKDLKDMCFRCHEDVKAEFSLPSHHPVPESRLFCTDCHDTHGDVTGGHMRKNTIKETCAQCHPDKEGPFVFGHADITEDCLSCHSQHGSINNNLLVQRVPFLCLQCHEGHRTSASGAIDAKAAFYTRCTDCHSEIHGSDIPSPSGTGRFIQ